MRTALALIFLLFSGQAHAQAPRDEFQVQLAASVVSAALAFIAPRALDAVTVQQLALWGLGAPAALDASLSTEVRDGAVVLMRGDRALYRRPIPPAGGPEEWGELVADMLRAAIAGSPALRNSGTRRC